MIFVHNPDLSKNGARLFYSIGSFAWISFSTFSLLYMLVFTEKKNILKTKLLYLFLPVLPLIFIYKQWTNFLIVDYIKQPYGWLSIWGNSYWTYLFLLYYLLFVGTGLYFVFNFRKKTKNMIKKKQAQIIFITTIVSLVLGSLTDFILPNMNIYAVPNTAAFFVLIWAFGTVYAIGKYKFLIITPATAADNIISTMSDCVILLKKDGYIVTANKATQDLLGYNTKELEGKSANILFEKENFKGIILDKILKEGKLKNYDVFLKTKDRRIMPVSFSASILKDEVKSIAGIVCIARDMTEYKKAEEALRDSEELYSSIVESMHDGIVVLDRKFHIKYWNHMMEKISGVLRKELINSNKCLWDIFQHIAEQGADKMIQQVMGGEVVERENIQYRLPDGTIVFISDIYLPLQSATGEIKGIVGVIRDITERKQEEEERKKLETRLQRAEKMEAIGQLAGGVAHDLNNVLSGVISYPDLLLMRLPEDSPLREFILTIQNSGQRAAAIVQDLLTLARRGVTVTEVVNLNDVISDYLRSPEYEKLKTYHPDVQFEINPETNLLNILGSPVHLSKTLMNLVSNATEALLDGGKVTISTRNKYIDRPIRGYDNVEKGNYAVLIVSDNGIGISAEGLEKIFEPFYTKKVMGRSGTGLGMAVVWGTVKDHKGYIDVHSKVGEGTTFELYFQVTRREAAKEKARIAIEEYMGNGEKVLVVDDVSEQRKITSELLTSLGYAVSVLPRGEEAVEYMKTNSADLLVLDMIMDPGIDGLETYRRILELHPGQKAIIVSGFSETERVREAQRLGVGQYIKKPYTLEKMGIAVKKELE